MAQDGTYDGDFQLDDDVVEIPITLRNKRSKVKIVSRSYRGGTNLYGEEVPPFGFDVVLAVYDSDGNRIACDDDVGEGCITDENFFPPHFDAKVKLKDLKPGDYTITVSQFDNLPTESLSDPFPEEGAGNFTAFLFGDGTGQFWDLRGPFAPNNPRTSFWSIDVTGAGCPARPLAACAGIGKKGEAALSIKANGRVDWSWIGQKTTAKDFGKPNKNTDYSFCVWEGPAQNPALSLALDVKAGKKWSALGDGFEYDKSKGNGDGVRSVVLLPGKGGEAMTELGARKAEVPALPLSTAGPVTAQLISNKGKCWEADFTEPAQNDADAFEASVP